MAELSRGSLITRSTGITLLLAAMLCGSSISVRAASKNVPASNQGPAAGRSEDRAATMPRYFTINQVLAQLDRQTQSGSLRPSFSIASIDVPVAEDREGAQPAAATRESDEPFGLTTFRAPQGLLWVKWRKVEAEIAEDVNVLAQCRNDGSRCSNPAAQKYLALVSESHRLQARAKIEWINRSINAAIRYTSDPEQHGVPDLWSAPLATLGSGRGDCEDYAIAKYALLRDAGFSSDDLRLLVVRDRTARQDHAVVGIRLKGRWLVLDNRHDVLLEPKDAPHLVPLFALNQHGVKLFAVPYDATAPSTPALIASDRADTAEPASTFNREPPSAEALGLRLDAFDPPALRGGL